MQSYMATKWENKVSKPGLVPRLVLFPLCLSRKDLSRTKDRVSGPPLSLGSLGELLIWCCWADEPASLVWGSCGRRAE